MPFTDYRVLFLFISPLVLNIIFLYLRYRKQPVKLGRRGHRYQSGYGYYPIYREAQPSSNFQWWEAVISFVLFVIFVIGMWYVGQNARISNFPEQIGGFITKMYFTDGSHEVKHESCSGEGNNRTCTTWYETVYHREYFIENSTGDWWDGNKWSQRVNKRCKDCDVELNRIPAYYAQAYVGKPVSLDHSYVNYIAPISEDMYRNTYNGLKDTLPDICTQYSDYRMSETAVLKAIPLGFQKGSAIYNNVYGWNFFSGDPSTYVNANYDVSAIPMYTDTIFGYLGSTVQADVHVYVVNSTNQSYADMCLAKWKMGAKNSIYVFIFGQSDGANAFQATSVKAVVAVDGTKKNTGLKFENEAERSNYYMKYDIQNQLMDYFKNGGNLDRENVLRIIFTNVSTKFVRQEMSGYKALKGLVYPTTGYMIFLTIITLIGDAILHFYLANNEY